MGFRLLSVHSLFLICPELALRFFLHDTLCQTDGACWTDQTTEVAAHTLGAYEMGLTGRMIEDDGLMSTVAARYLTASATYAQLLVELWIDDGVTIQMVGLQELRQLLAYEVLQLADTAFGHIALQTQDEVVDDAITILHCGRAHLYVVAAQLDKLQCVAPRLDTANATQFCFLGHL